MRKLFLALSLFFLLGLFVFAAYVYYMPYYYNNHKYQFADLAIVLSGGKGRIQQGLELLDKKEVSTMFVAGVYRHTNLDHIAATLEAPYDQLMLKHREQIFLSYLSDSTMSNAEEIAIWYDFNHFDSAYIVTNDYHIPRSKAFIKLAIPKVSLILYPVDSKALYSNFTMLRLICLEYCKLIYSVFYVSICFFVSLF